MHEFPFLLPPLSLCQAANQGCLPVLRVLLNARKRRGLDINAPNKEGMLALETSCKQAQLGAVRLLLADERTLVNRLGSTGASVLCVACSLNSKEMVEALLGCPRVDVRSDASLANTTTSPTCLNHK